MICIVYVFLMSFGSNFYDFVWVFEFLSIFYNFERFIEIEEFDFIDKFEEEDVVSNVEGRGEVLFYKVEISWVGCGLYL